MESAESNSRTNWLVIRVGAIAVLLTMLLAFLGYQAYALQVGKNQYFRGLADRQHVASMEIPAPRGGIFDRNGYELASSVQTPSIFANPSEVVDLTGTSEKLAKILGFSERELEARFASPSRFMWLRRHASDALARQIAAMGLKGIHVTTEPKRFYPGQTLAGHILGSTNIDGHGIGGLEMTLDKALTGSRAKIAALRDAQGKLTLTEGMTDPTPGQSVVLTIDNFIQFTTERAVQQAVRENAAKAGLAIVLDVQNGEILALASYPDFNPNQPQNWKEGRNRPVTDSYEVGSIMKIFTVAAALEANVVTPETQVDCQNGRMLVGNHTITDTHKNGMLSVTGVLKHSSNVGAVKIARLLGKEKLYQALVGLGFGKKVGIEMPGEQSGVLRKPEKWRETDFASVSYGYGVSVSPLQIIAALGAVGNEGVYLAPHIVKTVGGKPWDVSTSQRRVMSAQTARSVWSMMAAVFERGEEGGTAQTLSVPGIAVGGKTGTAHKLDPVTRSYGKLYLSSFAGLAPIDKPRIAVLVMIDEPDPKRHFGAEVAGPAWVKIVGETLPYLAP